MESRTRRVAFLFAIVLISAAGLATVAAQEHEHPATHGAGAHRHPQAAKMKNPVAADSTSIAAGKALYDKHCAGCHGDTGKGDGSMGAELNPKPPDLTDAEWKHGSTDGELFLVISDGASKTGMKPFKGKLTPHQVWDVVNYIRSIGPAKSH